jgi:D-sedoheptulose 7-phosphate isomerase
VVTAINTSVSTFIDGEIAKSRVALDALASPHYTQILTDIAGEIVESLRAGGKVLFCGNGGSAADSQHLAAELVGRQNYDRAPAAGIALTVDTSALTALGNDSIPFSLGRSKRSDVLVTFSLAFRPQVAP